MLGREWDEMKQGAESARTPEHTQDIPVSTPLSHIPCLAIELHISLLFSYTQTSYLVDSNSDLIYILHLLGLHEIQTKRRTFYLPASTSATSRCGAGASFDMSLKAPPQSLVKKNGMDRLPMPANQIFCIFIGFIFFRFIAFFLNLAHFCSPFL